MEGILSAVIDLVAVSVLIAGVEYGIVKQFSLMISYSEIGKEGKKSN